MQNSSPKDVEGISFEVTEEVLLKMRNSNGLHELIQEESVVDLKYIDVTHSKYRYVKRFLDIVCSVLGITILAIPCLIVAVAVYLSGSRNVIFQQYRVGRFGKRFKMYKFRSMKEDTPKYLSTMEVEEPDRYITKVGRFIRRFSIDELPQLVNVLVGNMSLVGPRPLISDEYEIHDLRMKFGVYNIRPGITGLAQINGRDTVTPAEKVHWDVKYLEDFGLWLDLKILIATIPKIFGGMGVVEGYAIHTKENDR